jgi:hypothetical protein
MPSPKSDPQDPLRDAPSMPSATRVSPGTLYGRQSASTAAAALPRRSAQRCICGDCALPFRKQAIAATASLRRIQ